LGHARARAGATPDGIVFGFARIRTGLTAGFQAAGDGGGETLGYLCIDGKTRRQAISLGSCQDAIAPA
jgi:hypothetical protein